SQGPARLERGGGAAVHQDGVRRCGAESSAQGNIHLGQAAPGRGGVLLVNEARVAFPGALVSNVLPMYCYGCTLTRHHDSNRGAAGSPKAVSLSSSFNAHFCATCFGVRYRKSRTLRRGGRSTRHQGAAVVCEEICYSSGKCAPGLEVALQGHSTEAINRGNRANQQSNRDQISGSGGTCQATWHRSGQASASPADGRNISCVRGSDDNDSVRTVKTVEGHGAVLGVPQSSHSWHKHQYAPPGTSTGGGGGGFGGSTWPPPVLLHMSW
ncbi:hypothetical protein HaLaN_10955, partial [Haematococcus lacustris]